MKQLYEAVFWLLSVFLWMLTLILHLAKRGQILVKKLARRAHDE